MTTQNHETCRAGAAQNVRMKNIGRANTVIYTHSASTGQHLNTCEARLASLRTSPVAFMSNIIGEFTDAGTSGLSQVFLRPGIRAMMQRVEEGGIAAVITDTPERFGRDPASAAALVDWLEARGVAVFVGSHHHDGRLMSLMIEQVSCSLGNMPFWHRFAAAKRKIAATGPARRRPTRLEAKSCLKCASQEAGE